MVDIVLKILLLLSPIAYGTNVSLNRFDLIFFYLATLSLITASLFDTPARTFKNIKIPLGAFLILIFINIWWSSFNQIVLANVLNIMFAAVSLMIIIMYAKEPKRYFKYIVYAGLINVVVFLFQKMGFNPILNGDLYKGEEGGIMGNAPRLVSYLTLAFPFVPIWCKGIFLVVALIVKEFTLIGLAWLMAIVFCIKNIKRKYFNVFLISLIVIALGGIAKYFSNIYQSFYLRWTIWKPTIELIFKRPFLGYGFGIYPEVASQFTKLIFVGQPTNCAFSSVLQFTFEIGLLGIVWIGFIIKYYKKYFSFNLMSKEEWGMVALLMLSLVEYPFQIPRLWITMIAIVGFFIIKITKEAENVS